MVMSLFQFRPVPKVQEHLGVAHQNESVSGPGQKNVYSLALLKVAQNTLPIATYAPTIRQPRLPLHLGNCRLLKFGWTLNLMFQRSLCQRH